MSNVFAVVVHWGDPHITNAAIDSLKKQTGVDLSIVVWDNGPFENSHLLDDSVRIETENTNLYWTPAINKAVETCLDKEEFILFMNNDIRLNNKSVGMMARILMEDRVGLVAPVGSGLGGMQDYVHHKKDYNAEKPSTRVAAIVGACVMLRRDTWDAIGPLDNQMPLGADDHDYCLRVKHEGFEIHVNHNDKIHHISHASGDSKNWNSIGKDSWDYFNEKWAGYFDSEEEAIKCHWGYGYVEGYEKGTGWNVDSSVHN